QCQPGLAALDPTGGLPPGTAARAAHCVAPGGAAGLAMAGGPRADGLVQPVASGGLPVAVGRAAARALAAPGLLCAGGAAGLGAERSAVAAHGGVFVALFARQPG